MDIVHKHSSLVHGSSSLLTIYGINVIDRNGFRCEYVEIFTRRRGVPQVFVHFHLFWHGAAAEGRAPLEPNYEIGFGSRT
jgi:hypothetical protein